jgi:hypothetical protein
MPGLAGLYEAEEYNPRKGELCVAANENHKPNINGFNRCEFSVIGRENHGLSKNK